MEGSGGRDEKEGGGDFKVGITHVVYNEHRNWGDLRIKTGPPTTYLLHCTWL